MRASSFDFMGNLDTLLAVILGAVLATGGALLAEIIQERLWRKRKGQTTTRVQIIQPKTQALQIKTPPDAPR